MTATLTASPTTTPPPQPTGARLRARWTIVAAIAAPILFTIGQTLLPELPNELVKAFPGMAEHRDQLLASRLITALGAFLFVPAVIAIWSLVRAGARGSRLLLAGGLVLGVGTICNAVSEVYLGYAVHAATSSRVTPEAGRSFVDATDHLGPVALPVSFLPVVVFAVGVLLTAAALLVARTVPVWQPVLLFAGAILAFATAGHGVLYAATGAPFTVAFVALAVTAWRRHG